MRKFVVSCALACAFAAAFAGGASAAAAQAALYDVILRGGRILDGSGRPAFAGDVAVRDGRIVAVGDLGAERAKLELDARGLFVAPGFINIHSHPDAAALATARNMLTQGVTTEIANPDGGGPVDVERQLDGYGRAGLAVNVGAYIGFNSVWQSVMGEADRRATPAEISQMQRLVLDGLRSGAWGVSAGLDYKPAYFADADEVATVISVAAPWRTNFPNHERLTPESGYSSRAGIAETLAIAQQAGLVPVVTHMKAQGAEQGRAGEVLEMVARAHGAGDVYPYTAGAGPLAALLMPAWATEGGEAAMFARFQDPALRARIVADIERAMDLRFGGASGVYVATLRRELADIAREMDASRGETILRLLEQRRPLFAYLRFGTDADVMRMLQAPDVAVACDCGATAGMVGHPRSFGTFPRVLGHYVRETGALSWEDAVRKMTGLPATLIGMTDRGFIAPGMAADIAVFDPKTVADKATYETPAMSVGVRFVLVNGQLAVRDGAPTGAKGGEVLRRDAAMPSRAMTGDGPRVLAGHASLAGSVIRGASADYAIEQAAGARTAQGSVRVRGARDAVIFEASAFGILQANGSWSSVTGMGRLAGQGDRAFRFTVDAADPRSPGRRVVTLDIAGVGVLSDAPEPAQ